MRLRFRLLLLLISSFWKKRKGLLDESVLTLTVLPNDVDITKISNDRYNALMDLGRMDIAFRAGLFRKMIKNKWGPLVTFGAIRYRYPLKIFQKYQLRSRIVWWDDTAGYFKQVFERKGRVIATAYTYTTFIGPNGAVPPDVIAAATGRAITKPEEPEIVTKLRQIEGLLHETQKD